MAEQEIGSVEVRAHYDPVSGETTLVEVMRADQVIGVTPEVVFGADHRALRYEDGLMVLGTAGAHRYRPVSFMDTGVIVCERVTVTDSDGQRG